MPIKNTLDHETQHKMKQIFYTHGAFDLDYTYIVILYIIIIARKLYVLFLL